MPGLTPSTAIACQEWISGDIVQVYVSSLCLILNSAFLAVMISFIDSQSRFSSVVTGKEDADISASASDSSAIAPGMHPPSPA